MTLVVTVVSPTAQSNLRVFPADVATPTASNLNWLPGQSPTPNKVDAKLSPDGKIKLFNAFGTVNVLADAVGYYTDSSLRGLAASQPFAMTATESCLKTLTTSYTDTLALAVKAPVNGKVTLNSTAIVKNSTGSVECVISESTDIPTSLAATSTPSYHFHKGDATVQAGSISGTRTFDIAASIEVTYVLACLTNNNNGDIRMRNMTAIFTPAP